MFIVVLSPFCIVLPRRPSSLSDVFRHLLRMCRMILTAFYVFSVCSMVFHGVFLLLFPVGGVLETHSLVVTR